MDAETTGFEPVTFGVTGQRSNQAELCLLQNHSTQYFYYLQLQHACVFLKKMVQWDMSQTKNLTKPVETETKYFVVCLVRPEIASLRAVEMTNELMEQAQATVVSQEAYNYSLAYKIDKNSRAHYIASMITMPKQNVKLLRKKVALNERFFRILVTKDLQLDITEAGIKQFTSNTTKRGRISFQKKLPRMAKKEMADRIKALRTIGILPCCNYRYTA